MITLPDATLKTGKGSLNGFVKIFGLGGVMAKWALNYTLTVKVKVCSVPRRVVTLKKRGGRIQEGNPFEGSIVFASIEEGTGVEGNRVKGGLLAVGGEEKKRQSRCRHEKGKLNGKCGTSE